MAGKRSVNSGQVELGNLPTKTKMRYDQRVYRLEEYNSFPVR
jgi:hypothetical protein